MIPPSARTSPSALSTYSRPLVVGLTVLAAAARGATVDDPLEYAPAPPDNPLRGLVPYVSASGRDRFPHSMEFRYFSLAELLKGPGQHDWTPLEETLTDVSARGNQLIFRVYCEFPGKGLSIPDFLVDAGVPMTEWRNPNDGKASFTPHYEHPALRAALASFITAMGARYDGDPRIGFITAGLLGSWGEWHTHPRDDLWASPQLQREVMDAYATAFTKTRILLRYPAGPDSRSYAENTGRPFGYHDDSFGWATLDTGRTEDAWFFEPMLRAARAASKWRRHPIGGEIRPELWSRSFTADPHPDDQGFAECIERVHVSWLMDSGLFDSRIPLDQARRDRALKQSARMGYELHVSHAEWTNGTLTLTVENRGVAPFYYDWPVEVAANGTVMTTDWKLRGILPGTPQSWSVRLPSSDSVKLRVRNPMSGGKPLRFANRGQGDEWLTIGPWPPAGSPAAQ